MWQMAEEATSAEASMDERPSQTPTDASGNYRFRGERQVQTRECTAGTVPFGRDDANFAVFASGQVGPQIAGRLSVRPGQVRVRQTWAL